MTDDRVLPVLDAAALNAFFDTQFPQVHADGRIYIFERVEPGLAIMRLDPRERHLRPGGTVSGPTLFTLSDYAAYGVILAHIGPVALTVTTHASMDFLRKAAPGPVRAAARLIKLGKRLAVVTTDVTDSAGDLIAHASMTYSVPPEQAGGNPAA
ncbi:MAG: PaaI family thioesterase [Rhizobiaceae bacterium]|jgi:uncharacterized protein (TIGR00369 family)|nr:PaaI family thioesterase [Rhizobiaceae bacterium]